MRRRIYAVGDAGFGWNCDGESGLERSDRARIGIERRKMGTRSGERHSLLAKGDGGQSGVAFGQSLEQAGLRRWERKCNSQLSQTPTTQRRGESDDRKSVESAERSAGEKAVWCAALDRRSTVGTG